MIATILGLSISKMPDNNLHMEESVLKAFNLHLEFNYMKTTDISISRIV